MNITMKTHKIILLIKFSLVRKSLRYPITPNVSKEIRIRYMYLYKKAGIIYINNINEFIL